MRWSANISIELLWQKIQGRHLYYETTVLMKWCTYYQSLNFSEYCLSRKQSTDYQIIHISLISNLSFSWFDRERAAEVIELLQGEHDFASFAFKPTNPLDTVRTLEIKMKAVKPLEISPQMQPQFQIYQIHFRSRAFLHNQVSFTKSSYI